MRIDKYLWCVRLFKTRSLATKQVDGEKVKLNGAFVKRGREISENDEISIKVNPIWKTYKIIGIPKSRVGAKLVPDYLIETTPKADLDELELLQKMNRENYSFGLKGRPTKKNRRDIDNFKD